MNYYRALELVEELTDLIEGNEYQQFLFSHLLPIEFEINRQLTNARHSAKLKE